MIAFRTCIHGHVLHGNTQTYRSVKGTHREYDRCRTCQRESVYRARTNKKAGMQRFRFVPDASDPRVALCREELAKRAVRHG